jgi:hypothetical protein
MNRAVREWIYLTGFMVGHAFRDRATRITTLLLEGMSEAIEQRRHCVDPGCSMHGQAPRFLVVDGPFAMPRQWN